jgi:YD repeat-containing protein
MDDKSLAVGGAYPTLHTQVPPNIEVAPPQRGLFGWAKFLVLGMRQPPHIRGNIVLFACLLGMTHPGVAQLGAYGDTNSTPIPGTGHGYISDLNETVDPESGGLSVRIAAPTPTERGISRPIYAYMYDSNGQNVLVPSWGYNSFIHAEYVTNVNYQPPTNVGKPNSVSYDTNIINTFLGTGFPVSCTVWNNFIYTDPNGGRHPITGLQGTSNTAAVGCEGLGILPSATGQTGGDIYYTGMYEGNGAAIWVWDKHGNLVAATDSLGGDSVVEDTNGNFLNGTGRSYSIVPDTSTIPNPLGGPYTSVTIPGLGGAYTFSSSIGTRGATTPFPFNVTFPPGQAGATSCPASFDGSVGGYSGTAALTLPNQQHYSFSIEPTFGLLNHIVYPTGATVDYTWTTNAQSRYVRFSLPSSSPAAVCSYLYDWPAVKTRIVSLGGVQTQEQDFAYTTTWGNGIGEWTQKTTTVITKDLLTAGTPSFKTVYTYRQTDGTETVATYDTTGSLLQSVTKLGMSFDNPPSLPLGQCTTLNNGSTSGVFYQYQQNHPFPSATPTDVAEYDYGAITGTCQQPSGVTPARETITQFHTSFPATPISQGLNLMADRPDTVKVYGNGNLVAETDYTYDEYSTYPLSAVTPVAIAHDDTGYSASSTTRGNATTVTVKCFLPDGTACADSVMHTTYDITGQPVAVTDGLSHTTQYSYADNYTADDGSPNGNTNTYVTKITRPTTNGVAHIQTFQYGFNDGKLRTSVDENSQSTTFCYKTGGCTGTTFDPWFRQTGVINPDQGGSTTSYSDAGPSPTTTTTSTGTPSIVSKTIMDQLGRTTQTQLTSDPNGTVYVDATYDGFGHMSSGSTPYRSTAESTYGITSFTYDSLGRKLLQCQPDNGNNTPCAAGTSYLQWSYAGNATTAYDERRIPKQQTSDGLGRLIQVLEIDSEAPIITTCGPQGCTSRFNYSHETDYTYNALNSLLNVTQHGNSATPRIRQFTYDSLSRLITANNPETGTVCYGIWNASKCINGYDANGNLSAKTDARGVVVSYSYDFLNRLVSKTFSDGTVASCYQYDTPYVSGTAGNFIGRRTTAWTQAGHCVTPPAPSDVLSRRSVLAYDPMGRVLNEQQCTRSNCGVNSYSPSYTYNPLGDLHTYSSGIPSGAGAFTFTNGYDTANHLTSVTSSNTQYPSTLFTVPSSTSPSTCSPAGSPSQPGYSPAGALMNAVFGVGLQVSRTYDSRLRVNCETDTGNSVSNPTPGSATITLSGTDQTH